MKSKRRKKECHTSAADPTSASCILYRDPLRAHNDKTICGWH